MAENQTTPRTGLVGSPEWLARARAAEARDQNSRVGDYFSDAWDEIARLRRLLGLNPEQHHAG